MANISSPFSGGGSGDNTDSDSADSQQSQSQDEPEPDYTPPSGTQRAIDQAPEPASTGEDQSIDRAPSGTQRAVEKTPEPASTGEDQSIDRAPSGTQRAVERAPEPASQAGATSGINQAPSGTRRAVERTPDPAAATGATSGSDPVQRFERGAANLSASIGAYITDVQRRSREGTSPVAGLAFTEGNIEQAEAGERNIANRASQRDISAQLFQYGKQTQLVGTDVEKGVSSALFSLSKKQTSVPETAVESGFQNLGYDVDVPNLLGATLDAKIAGTTIRKGTTGAAGVLAASPLYVAGSVPQIGTALIEGNKVSIQEQKDLVQAARSGESEQVKETVSSAVDRRVEVAQTFTDTAATGTVNLGKYAASNPIEAGIVFGAPAVAGGGRAGIARDVARAKRAGGATKGIAQSTYRTAPNRLTDPITRTTGRTKFKVRDVRGKSRYELSKQKQKVRQLQDAFARSQSRTKATARETKADIGFEAQRARAEVKSRVPDSVSRKTQRAQDTMFRFKQRQRSRAREAKAATRYTKSVASSKLVRKIQGLRDAIDPRRASDRGGFDTIATGSNLRLNRKGKEYPTFEPDSGLNPFRETDITIEGTKTGRSKGSGNSRGGVKDVRKTKGYQQSQRTASSGSQQRAILKYRERPKPKESAAPKGTETLTRPSQNPNVVLPPTFVAPETDLSAATPGITGPELEPEYEFPTGEVTDSVDVLSPPTDTTITGTVTEQIPGTTPTQEEISPPTYETPTATTTTSIGTPETPTTTVGVPVLPTVGTPRPPRRTPTGLPYLGAPGQGGRFAPRDFESYTDEQYEFEFTTVQGFLTGGTKEKKNNNGEMQNGFFGGLL